jgi:hypothetical protein
MTTINKKAVMGFSLKPLPAGVTGGLWRYTILDASNNPIAHVDVNSTTCQFTLDINQSFTATVQLLDSTGQPIDAYPPVTYAFNTNQPVVNGNVPTSLTVANA